MVEVELSLAFGALVVTYVSGIVTNYIFTKYKNPDLDGDGKIEAEEIKVIVDDAMNTFGAFHDAIDDIIEDTDLEPEEALVYIKNINKIFRK